MPHTVHKNKNMLKTDFTDELLHVITRDVTYADILRDQSAHPTIDNNYVSRFKVYIRYVSINYMLIQ